MKIRSQVVPGAQGVVLEVGCGTGTNFGFYDPARVTQLIAIEPHAPMLARADAALADQPIAAVTRLLAAGGESLPLEDGSVDTVVLTYVLCTIPSPEAALAEVRRVLRPGGLVLFAEHGLSPDTGVAKWQKRWEPFQKRLGGGCHVTRNPSALMMAAGLEIADERRFYMKSAPKILGYTYTGMARAAG